MMKTRILTLMLLLLSMAVFSQQVPSSTGNKRYKNLIVNNKLEATKVEVDKNLVYDEIISNTIVADTGDTAMVTINWAVGSFQKLILTDTVEVKMTAPDPAKPAELILWVQHATNTTVYPIYFNDPIVKWVGGTDFTATAASGAIDVIRFLYNGTYYYAFFDKDYKD